MRLSESLARAGVPVAPRQGTNPEAASFDCVLMKREIQTKIAAETAGMSWDEEMAYYRRKARAGPLGHWCEVEGGTSTHAGSPPQSTSAGTKHKRVPRPRKRSR